MRRRLAVLVWALPVAAVLPLASGTTFALEADAATGGPQQLVSAALNPAPTAPGLTTPGCPGTGSQATGVALSWTDSQSATLDAAGGSLVSGYSVARSTTPAGPYAAVTSTSGGPAPTTATDAPPTTGTGTALVVDGTAAGSKLAYSLPEATQAASAGVAVGTTGVEPNNVQTTPDGAYAVLAESTANQVQVLALSGTTWSVVKTLAVTDPIAVAVNPVPAAGTYTAYVLSFAGTTANSSVYPVSVTGATSTLGAAVAVAHTSDPAAMLVTPNGTSVYVADLNSHTVSVLPTTGGAATSVTLPGTAAAQPDALAVTPDSSHVYVADRANSWLDDITVATATVGTHVVLAAGGLNDTILPTAGNPNTLAMTPTGQGVYVAEFGTAEVQLVHTALSPTTPDTVVASIAAVAGSQPIDLAMSPNGCQVYVADWPSNNIFVIATPTNTLSTVLTTACWTQDPQPMQVTPDNKYLVIPENYRCGDVQILNTATNAVTTVGTVGAYPAAVAIPPVDYYYEVTASHLQWTSIPSSPAMVAVGWNPGGWQ